MIARKYLFLILLIASVAFTGAAFGSNEPSINGTTKADPVFQDSGLAIHGYDPVAYFTVGKPVPGKEEFEYKYQGATWRFASAANQDAFAKDPAKYAPQYGGYCAFGMSRGYAVSTEPDAWTIVKGKLYLNYNVDVLKQWSQDIPGYIEKANTNWPKIPKNSTE